MSTVTVDEFAKLITKSLEDYEEGVEERVEQTINEVAKDTLEDLKNNSIIPERSQDNNYKNSFFVKNIYKSRGREKGVCKLVVTNKKYQIGHLLENGHATRNGKRTKAFPHWVDAQKVADTLPERLKEALE